MPPVSTIPPLDEFVQQIKSHAEAEIREGAIKAGTDPDGVLAELRAAFSVEEIDQLIGAADQRSLNAIRKILGAREVPIVITLAEGMLRNVPASNPPPEASASTALDDIAQLVRTYLPHVLEGTEPDWVDRLTGTDYLLDEEEDATRGLTPSLRTVMVERFDDRLPGVSGKPTDRHLAVAFAWIFPVEVCDGRRHLDWPGLRTVERRAMERARSRGRRMDTRGD